MWLGHMWSTDTMLSHPIKVSADLNCQCWSQWHWLLQNCATSVDDIYIVHSMSWYFATLFSVGNCPEMPGNVIWFDERAFINERTLLCLTTAVILPTIWKYLQTLDAQPYFLGLCLSAFSLSGLLVGPLFGHWSDRTQTTKKIILFANLFEIVGELTHGLKKRKKSQVMQLSPRLSL